MSNSTYYRLVLIGRGPQGSERHFGLPQKVLEGRLGRSARTQPPKYRTDRLPQW
jgi:hypothetical protein